MQTKNQISLTRKTLYVIMVLAIFLSAFSAGNLPSVHAQEGATGTSSEIMYIWSPVANMALYWSLNSENGGPGLRPYDLNLYNAETDDHYILASDGYSGLAKFSMNGSKISFWYNNAPYIVNLYNNTISTNRVETDNTPVKGAFSSNNEFLIYTTETNEIRVRNLTTNLETSLGIFEGISTLPYLFPEWSPNDQWVVFGTESNGILIDPSGINNSIVISDLALPQSEISSAAHYFIWSTGSNSIYDHSGKLVYTFTSETESAPMFEPESLSFDATFEILYLDGELFLHHVASSTRKQLTSNNSTIEQILELVPPVPLNEYVTTQAVADGFDFPVGRPNMTGYNFTAGCWWLQNDAACPGPHPGQDINGNGGGDSDLGDPVYAVANGTVVFSGVGSGTSWGNIIMIEHTLPDGSKVWSQYAHLRDRYVTSGTVNKGDQIGTIGKGYNNTAFYAHLHFEIRIQYRAADAWISGWSTTQVMQYYVKPEDFINSHRIIGGSCPSVSGEVRLYDLTNCGGDSVTANGTGLWSMASSFNDRAESIAIPSGWSARLYQNDNENSNESACFGSTDANLNDNTFANGGGVGNNATWMRVYDNTSCSGGVSTPPAPSLSSPGNGSNNPYNYDLNFQWNSSSGATEYLIEWWGGPYSTMQPCGWSSSTSCHVGTVAAGNTYSWHVKARNSAGESGWSSTWTFTIQANIPNTPPNFRVSGSTQTSITVAWDDVSNETGYKIYKWNGSTSTFDYLASVGANITSYTETRSNCGWDEYYEVSAYNGNGESTHANWVHGYTQDCPPLPSANFDAWPQSGTAPFTSAMHIVDTSNITSCSWDYGDSQTGTSCASLHDHIYNTAGTFTVSLTVSGPGGSDSMTRTNYISVTASGDSYEPDDSSGAASWISSGSTQTHSIIPATDVDWVKFQLTSPSAITLETTGPTGYDTRMWLYDSSMNQLEYSDDEGVDNFSLIDRQCGIDALPSGIYYVKVDDYGNDSEISTYFLSYNGLQTCVTTPPAPILSIPNNGSSNPYNYDLNFQWNSSSGATEYLVEWWGGPYSTMQPCGWSNSTTCHIGTVVPGNTYSWHVKARNSAGESNWSSTWTFVIQSQPCYTLTKNSNPAAGGTVNANPAPNCNSGTQYTSGTVVSLTAAPNTGYVFSNWSGDASGSSSPVNVTMSANKSVTATFTVNPNYYTLTVSTTGTGSGTVTGTGINCPGDCSESYVSGTSVTLTASPLTGSTFAGWSGACTGTGSCVVSMTTSRSVTATFDNNNGGDSYEPDNTSGQAKLITSGTRQTHSIIPATDVDWVKFQLNGTSAITLETTGSTGADTRMWLYNSSLTVLEFNDDEGVDYYSLIDRQCGVDALPAGIYYVKVDEYGNNDEISAYDLAFNITQSCSSNVTFTAQSAGANDGFVLESSETSSTGGTMNSAATQLYIGDNAANRQYRDILSFDTSGLPDNAIIIKVTLKFKHIGFTGTSPFTTHGNLIVDVRKGVFSNNSALQLNDFKATASKNNVLSFTSALVNNWYSKSFSAANFQYINLLGVTQFRLRFAKDDNNDFGADFLKIYSGNAGAANRPQLVIEYYVP